VYLTQIPGTTYYALVGDDAVFPLNYHESLRSSEHVEFRAWYTLTDEEQARVHHAYMTSALRKGDVIGSTFADSQDDCEPPCVDPRPDPRTHPEYWCE
jgi:hypothetical protein